MDAPHAWFTLQPSLAAAAFPTSVPRGAAPDVMHLRWSGRNSLTAGCLARPMMMGGTNWACVAFLSRHKVKNFIRSNCGMVTTSHP